MELLYPLWVGHSTMLEPSMLRISPHLSFRDFVWWLCQMGLLGYLSFPTDGSQTGTSDFLSGLVFLVVSFC